MLGLMSCTFYSELQVERNMKNHTQCVNHLARMSYLGKSFLSLIVVYAICLDVLEKNLITNTVRLDLSDDKNKRSNEPKGLHLKALVKAINDCGIPFKVWEKLDKFGWPRKKKLLLSLPDKFKDILKPAICDTVTQIWKVL